ncbi:putative ABC transporter ATP-binding protein [Paenibacillus solanacearum]|uniref:ABC transporter ATP-binding protein n=2 Tax=Paenibacillus solanacearum TaxID=2048548 RepID=A0A916K5A2_9BACL|nr:putative ABC transporter ATP-binding protein [Paenibacillus solanacearum]
MKPFRILRRYLASLKLLCALYAASVVVEIGYVVAFPLSLKFLVDTAFIPKDVQAFLFILGLLLIGGLLNVAAGAGGDYTLAKLSGRMLQTLRTELFEHVQKQSVDFYTRYRTGEITTRFNSDLLSIEQVVGATFPLGLKQGFTAVAGLCLLFTLEWRLALALLLGSSLLFVGPKLLRKPAEAANLAVKEAEGHFANTIDEMLKGHKTIKALRLQQAMLDRARGQILSLYSFGLRRSFMNSLLERVPMTSLMALNAIMIGFGGYLIFQDKLSIGGYIAFFTLFMSVSQAVFHLSILIPYFIESSVSFERVQHMLEDAPTVVEADLPAPMPPLAHTIAMDNVTFGYTEDHPVLKGLSLSIPAGSFAAFVGPSGSGKSTALQLLLRFYDPDEGRITYDGLDVKQISERSLREQVGIVFQDTFLFNASIKQNLQLSDPLAAEEDWVAACKAAHLHETIRRWPEGYDTPIIQEGGSLSGGQRQRLSIARTLLRKPSILLLDEVTSALDFATEADINRAIAQWKGGSTIISVTHRLASIIDADLIFVFQDGNIAESGTHGQLLERKGLYREMWEKQYGFRVPVSESQA